MTNSYKLSLFYGGFHGNRMLIGAINSIFLLSTGVTLNKLAVLQIVFSISVLFLEFPSGFISDLISKKLSVLLSAICMGLYYILCLGAPNMIILIVSQIIYALGMCLSSGALEGWIVENSNIDYNYDKSKIAYFGYLRTEATSFISMFAGPLGCIIVLISSSSYYKLYIFTAVIMFIFAILFYTIPNTSKYKMNIKSGKSDLKNNSLEILRNLKICFSNKSGIYYLIISSCLAATYQIIFFYWQPFFTQVNSYVYGFKFTHNEILLAIVFFTYSLSKLYLNKYFRKNSFKYNAFRVSFKASIICSILIILLCLINKNIIFTIINFAIFQGILSLIDITTQVEFLKTVPEEVISSSLSAINSITTILSLIVLSLIGLFINDNNLKEFFMATSIFYIVIATVVLAWKNDFKKNENKV